VNFGYFGMYISSAIAGMVVMMITKYLDAISLDEIRIPLTFIFSAQLMKLSMTNFTYVFINIPIFLLLAVLLLAIFFSQGLSLFKTFKSGQNVNC
jgi:hypothetical protein